MCSSDEYDRLNDEELLLNLRDNVRLEFTEKSLRHLKEMLRSDAQIPDVRFPACSSE